MSSTSSLASIGVGNLPVSRSYSKLSSFSSFRSDFPCLGDSTKGDTALLPFMVDIFLLMKSTALSDSSLFSILSKRLLVLTLVGSFSLL